ncbi:hypothetical protein H8D83_01950 [Candidatus Woesearchaeota archaeon]|nr:hypothetical protein [Candidatus Woesearchaeota archaeon]MBL7051022.1 hypothetical protein [Candidatus Woesearchaeota archaeon]
MGVIKTMAYTALLAGGIAGGYYFGANSCSADQDYKINRENEIVSLESKTLGLSYELNQIGEDFYLGDSNHNLKGVQALAIYETEKKDRLKINGLESKLDSLETKFNIQKEE